LEWLLDEPFVNFFVVPDGAVPVSGAIVGEPPVVWAYDSIGNVLAARNVSKANPEITAFMR
jgi:hypothetical protein